MRKLTVVVFCMACLVQAYAQDTGKEAMAVMQKLAGIYKAPEGLSFDVAYRYAAEETPGKYLDSLFGQMKLKDDKYWYRLDSTESVRTDTYLIMLFREDEVMYLAKPSAATATANPLAMIDNFFTNSKRITCHLTEDKAYRSVIIDFDGGGPYKRVEYRIDKHSGYLVNVISTVRAEQLYDASVRNLVEGAASYAVVEAAFTNYRQGEPDSSLFDSNHYFRKEGNEYITAADFRQYKIFLGSPGF